MNDTLPQPTPFRWVVVEIAIILGLYYLLETVVLFLS